MDKMLKTVVFLFISASMALAGCSSRTTTKQGPSINAGPVTISATINDYGEVTLSGSYQYALVGNDVVGAGIQVEFQDTLNAAQQKSNTLYILYKDAQGQVHRQEYDINQPFDITFTNQQWVQKIQRDDNGNVVVYVQVQTGGNQAGNSGNNQGGNGFCGSALSPRLKAGGYAFVAYNPPIDNLVHSNPGLNAPQVGSITTGHSMKVLDGPQCADEHYWWKVQALRNASVIGWTAESDSSEYWLVPCGSLSSCP